MTTERDASGITPGPWRWNVNEQDKIVELRSDANMGEIVMDFVRYGMNGAAPRFRDTDTQLMERADAWADTVAGREHHRKWLATIAHANARAIELVPEMIAALREKHSCWHKPASWCSDKTCRLLAQLDNPDAPRIAD